MSQSGSRAQFGQMSLGPDFDRYVGQMMVAGSHRDAMQRRGPADDHEVSISMTPSKAGMVAHTGNVVNGFAPKARLLHRSDTYESNRRAAEGGLFGVPEDAPHDQRPIYAYLRGNEAAPGPYGHAVLDIHPRDRRITTTPGDSLNNYSQHGKTVGTYGDQSGFDDRDVEQLSTDHRHDDYLPDEAYREVQVHGGPIPLKEVKRATLYHLPGEDDFYLNSIDTREALLELRRAKVPTRVMRHMEYQPTLDPKTFGKGQEGWVNEEAYRSGGSL